MWFKFVFNQLRLFWYLHHYPWSWTRNSWDAQINALCCYWYSVFASGDQDHLQLGPSLVTWSFDDGHHLISLLHKERQPWSKVTCTQTVWPKCMLIFIKQLHTKMTLYFVIFYIAEMTGFIFLFQMQHFKTTWLSRNTTVQLIFVYMGNALQNLSKNVGHSHTMMCRP